MTASRNAPLVLVMLSALGLTGCGDGGVQEVKQWMDEVRGQTVVSVPKVAESKTFTPFAYSGKEEVDPYSPAKLSAALAKQKGGGGSIKPDLDRRRETLEAFPLDTVKMVGTLERPGLSYALLQVDKAVFQAKVGNYVGQNLGKIVRISDTEVEIVETVQDPTGDWTERKAKLELQENNK
jgi:type IV pilus assembly protein PilP